MTEPNAKEREIAEQALEGIALGAAERGQLFGRIMRALAARREACAKVAADDATVRYASGTTASWTIWPEMIAAAILNMET